VRLALDVRGSASGTAQWIASAISAHECQDLGGVVSIRSGFAHTILRYAERLFDLVGCSAGACYEARLRTASSEWTHRRMYLNSSSSGAGMVLRLFYTGGGT